MKEKCYPKYRGIRPAEIVEVLEGDGTKENPYYIVSYVLEYQSINGFKRLTTAGKLAKLTDEERSFLGNTVPPNNQ